MEEMNTTSDVEAQLERDILEHELSVEKNFIIILTILIFLFHGWFSYWLRFGIAIPTKFAQKNVDVYSEPVQINYSAVQRKKKSFIYKSFINKNKIFIIPQAHYELSGQVVAFNHSFVFTNDFFDSAALYDLGTAWGKLGDKKFYNKYYKSYSQKNELYGSRILWTSPKTYPTPVSDSYATSHWSHSHLVPANRNIMAALLKIKIWDKVKIEGDLIDMQFQGMDYHTSMSRTDRDPGDRGNGSCESVYVTKVQIGNVIYE